MAKVIDLFRRRPEAAPAGDPAARLLAGFSLEVMPRTAAKVESFAELLPEGTAVYVAHVDGTPVEDMVATAARLAREGFEVVPHLPARSIPDRAALADLLARYRGEAGVRRALLLGGGRAAPVGDFHCAAQLLETGLFDRAGFARLDFAGHPEGSRDLDPAGGEANAMEALRLKRRLGEATGARLGLVTQFAFEAAPVAAWARRLRAAGLDLPVRVGVAGPAKLQTLIRYAMTCGVGPSVQVLRRRATDVTRLALPFAPDGMLRDLAAELDADPGLPVEGVHLFPLGGIGATADFAARLRAGAVRRAARA